MTIQTFPTGAVLSVVTGVLVSENHMDGIYQVLNFMTGESLFTHQLPRVAEEARPVILAMHPHLQETVAEAEQVNHENHADWLRTWKGRYGDEIAVPKMTIAQHERIDPMSELSERIHPDKIIVVQP